MTATADWTGANFADGYARLVGAAQNGLLDTVKEWMEKVQLLGLKGSRDSDQTKRLNALTAIAIAGGQTGVAEYLFRVAGADIECTMVWSYLAESTSNSNKTCDMMLSLLPNKDERAQRIQSLFCACGHTDNLALATHLVGLGAKESWPFTLACYRECVKYPDRTNTANTTAASVCDDLNSNVNETSIMLGNHMPLGSSFANTQKSRSSLSLNDEKRKPKPVLMVDMDDVLCAYVEGVMQWHNEQYGTRLALSDVKSFEFDKVWGGDVKQTLDKIRLFSRTPHYSKLRPLDGAKEALQVLKQHYDLVVVTARGEETDEVTRQWLKTHLGANSFQAIVYTGDKAKAAKDMGALAMIDDSWKHVSACHAIDSIRSTILFNFGGRHLWAKVPSDTTNTSKFPKLRLAQSWAEIVTLLSH